MSGMASRSPPTRQSGQRRGAKAPPADEGWLSGQILIAMPGMLDPRFAQTVIYLCAHSPEGAMGLVINKPMEALSFDELLTQLEIAPTPPARRIRVQAGGPVDTVRGFVLHTADWVQDGSLRVNDAMALTASIDVLREIAKGGGPRESLLALGYAGWGPGQLDREITENAWLHAPADEALIFTEALETRWRAAMARLGIDPLLLSGTAGRA
jgi:putative transcriptional regulator